MIIYIALLLFGIFAQPFITTPSPIDNVVYLNNVSDYAIYRIMAVNPTNETYYLSFLELSINWNFIYPTKITLNPGESKEIVIKIRPKKYTSELPYLLAIFYSFNKKYRYDLMFNPIIIKREGKTVLKNITRELTWNISLQKLFAYPGDIILSYLTINNPYRKPIKIKIKIYSEVLSENIEKTLRINPGKNEIIFHLKISNTILPGKYKVYVELGEKRKELELNILNKKYNITIIKKGNIFLVKNNEKRIAEYKFKIEIKPIDILFYKFNPSPKYYIKENNKLYGVWDLILLPNESYTIKKNYNYLNITIIALLVILIILYLLLRIFTPKVYIKKEIVKVDTKNREIKILITLGNFSLFRINNIKIREELLGLFDYKSYEFIKPVGSYKKNNKTIIEWFIDYLDPKDEIVITYTITYSSEVVGELEIDPTIVEFEFMKSKYKIESNRLYIKFAK